jgi:pimeloyl-ACP methyl ester carboxylesterase
MATFALVHGSQHGAWCWDRLVPELEARGHHVVAPDLPCDDPEAGISDYADVVVDAIGDADDVVVVGHSLGSLTVPVVASRRPVTRMVFLCSVPTGPGPAIDADLSTMVTKEYQEADQRTDDLGRDDMAAADARIVWYADATPEDAEWAIARLRPQSRRPLLEPSPIDTWPDAPSTVILGEDDGCVNHTWALAAATARLGGEAPIVIAGGHSPMLVRPVELADILDALA